jgi:uncharacterized protein (TIGR03663 family)
MNSRKFYLLLWILVFLTAAALRLPLLSLRPMHTDEAVHAFKFAELLENGQYEYNPQEYHGPTLYYLTLPGVWLCGYHNLPQLGESILRLVPVGWGLLTIFIFVILARYINRRAIFLAALFYALSAVIVYYNRYYIHETLLTVFVWSMLAFGYMFVKEKKGIYAVLCGISVGLLISTKETWMIYMGAAVLTVVLLPEWRKAFAANIIDTGLLIFAPALLLVGLFYTSFFTNPQGIPNFIHSITIYFHKGIGAGSHAYPWYYYLKNLFYFKGVQGPVWSEAFLLVLAVLGIIFVFVKKFQGDSDRGLLRLIAVFTLLVLVIFSLIPYKIPWNILGWMPGIVLVAGWATDYLLNHFSRKPAFHLFSLILILGMIHQAWQCWQLNYRFECSPANPYVYAHPGKDMRLVEKTLNQLAGGYGRDLRIDVVFTGHDYWPLPWYLRSFKYTGWWNTLDLENPPAPVVLLSPDQEEKLLQKIYAVTPREERQLYMTLFDHDVELRPGLEMRGYIRYDHWQKLKTPARAEGLILETPH